jgi:hypothetical protein
MHILLTIPLLMMIGLITGHSEPANHQESNNNNNSSPQLLQELVKISQEIYDAAIKQDADEFPGLGDWIAARQFAIFEMFYYLREAALPVLRRVAFGEYDWTQGNAIEVLCRFAAEGIDRERTLADLKSEMPVMRYEALLYAAGPLLQQAKDIPQLAAIVEELRQAPGFNSVVEDLR